MYPAKPPEANKDALMGAGRCGSGPAGNSGGNAAQTQKRASIVAALGALLSCLIAHPAAAATPLPPTNLCIDDNGCQVGIKWHPGHYMVIQKSVRDQSKRFAIYDTISSNADIKGVALNLRWAELEGDTPGDYSSGIELIRSELAKLKSLTVPKRLTVLINDFAMGTTLPASLTFPSYLYSKGKLYQDDTYVRWKRWDSEAMGSFISMLKVYGAAFDDEPYFEAIVPFYETAPGQRPADFSEAAHDAQIRRCALELRNAWPTTNVWIALNWGVTGTRLQELVAYLSSIDVASGNPDICPSCDMPIDRVIRGATGGHDYRGEIGNFMRVEGSTMGYGGLSTGDGFTAQEIYDYANNTQRVNYLFWTRLSNMPKPEQNWDTGILPVIKSNPVTNNACPYRSCSR